METPPTFNEEAIRLARGKKHAREAARIVPPLYSRAANKERI
jgi:hypothetical protein